MKKEQNIEEPQNPQLNIGAVIGSAFEFDVNHSFWSDALSTIDKKQLIELCEKLNIPTKGKDRFRLASNLAKRVSIDKMMKLVVGFD